MRRSCGPEILDSLPFDHPDAIHSRRDLRLVNAFMGNRRWFARTLPGLVRPGERVLELGSGTGEMGVALNALGIPVDGLDLCPRPRDWPAGSQWHQADLKGFQGYGAYAVVIGNLIFHQFTDGELAELGRALRRSTRAVVASEPTRRRLSQSIMALVAPVLGANYVTLHDARVSIGAGFQGTELPRALGMDGDAWDCTCLSTGLGASRMVALRRP